MTGIRPDLARARVLLDLKRYAEAASLLALVVAVEPEDSRAWCLLAQAHLGNAQYQEAADAAKRAITLAPSNDWPYRLASIAYRHLGHSTSAWKAATEACKLAPDQWQSYVCLAQAELARRMDFDAAERAAANARRLAPDEPEVHYVSGLASFTRGYWKAARAHQERTLALNPGHSGALNELGRLELRRRSHAGAAQHFIQAAQSAPGVATYGQNLDLVVRRVVALMIGAAVAATLALVPLTDTTHIARGTIVAGYTVTVLLIAGYGTLQLWRLPPQMRPLFRTRRVRLALGAVFGSILIAVIVAAVTPPGALPFALLAAAVLVFASAFAVRAISRHKNSSTVGRRHDQAHSSR
jgi:tetratricopeptide (TPR) repeat protein